MEAFAYGSSAQDEEWNPGLAECRRRRVHAGRRCRREGSQFRGGTRGRKCLESDGEQRWLDYRAVIGDGLFWYRRRRLDIPGDDLTEEIAGFPRGSRRGAAVQLRHFVGGEEKKAPVSPSSPLTCMIAGVARHFPHARRSCTHARTARQRLAALAGT